MSAFAREKHSGGLICGAGVREAPRPVSSQQAARKRRTRRGGTSGRARLGADLEDVVVDAVGAQQHAARARGLDEEACLRGRGCKRGPVQDNFYTDEETCPPYVPYCCVSRLKTGGCSRPGAVRAHKWRPWGQRPRTCVGGSGWGGEASCSSRRRRRK
jgi:hypothetical protein